MVRRDPAKFEEPQEIDLIPMMDLSLNLTFFFVVLTTLAKDEVTQRVNLPAATSQVVAEEERYPDSLKIIVDDRSYVVSFAEAGLIDMKTEAGTNAFANHMRLEAARAKAAQPGWKKQGFNTVLIIRADENIEFEVFRKIIDISRSVGYRRFVLKARVQT